MKKLFLLLFLSISIMASGQFNSGGIYWTGTTGLGTGLERQIDDYPINIFNFSLHPEVGYFIKNKIAIGAGIHTEFGLPFGSNVDLYAATYDMYIGPNVRYYIPRASDFQLYVYGNLQYGAYQRSLDYFEAEYNRHQYYGFQVGPGINYFFTERIALDARANFRFRHAWNAAMGGNHDLIGVVFEFGFSVFFPSISFFDMTN